MNNENPKNEKPKFILNDIIKRKILEMYKISSENDLKGNEETKKSEPQDRI